MRLGVLDIGSNTGHLLVVDAYRGAAPMPASSYKEELRLAEHLVGVVGVPHGRGGEGVDLLAPLVLRELEGTSDELGERVDALVADRAVLREVLCQAQ